MSRQQTAFVFSKFSDVEQIVECLSTAKIHLTPQKMGIFAQNKR